MKIKVKIYKIGCEKGDFIIEEIQRLTRYYFK